jgi:hypothetical protein
MHEKISGGSMHEEEVCGKLRASVVDPSGIDRRSTWRLSNLLGGVGACRESRSEQLAP